MWLKKKKKKLSSGANDVKKKKRKKNTVNVGWMVYVPKVRTNWQ